MPNLSGPIAVFVTDNITESIVLSFFESTFVPEELLAFAKEDGFNAPNDFPFEEFLEPARKNFFLEMVSMNLSGQFTNVA